MSAEAPVAADDRAKMGEPTKVTVSEVPPCHWKSTGYFFIERFILWISKYHRVAHRHSWEITFHMGLTVLIFEA